MTSMSKAALFASAAGLAAGLKVTTQPNEVIQAAIDRLEGMWPQKGKQILEDIFGSIPPHDEGRGLQQRLQRKFQRHETFVFAAFGSSVSAGHDNFINQSWPFELERLLKPTFKELGFDFEMRQRAAGGYGEMPFAAGCLASRAGDGVDALSWEWHMFRDSPCEGHHFLSEATAMKSSPSVFAFADTAVLFDTQLQIVPGADARGGDAAHNECKKAREELRDATMARKEHDTWDPESRDWKPNEWYLTEEFITNAEVDRFSRELKSRQCGQLQKDPKKPPEMNWLQQTGVAPAFEKAGLAFYPVSVGAGTTQIIDLPWYQAREKAFNINWHPGPLGHTLIASSYAHFILTNLKSALISERRRQEGPTDDNPLVGKPIVGQLTEPQCGSLKVDQCKTGMFPVSKSTDELSRISGESDHTWEYAISMQAAETRREAVDKRWVYRGNKTSGELKLNFVAPNDGMYVVICGAPCGWRCQGKAGFVSSMSQRWWPEGGPARNNVSDLKFSIDGNGIMGKELPKLHEKLFGKEAGVFCPDCKNPASLCQPVAKVAAGQHTIGARVEPRSWEGADGEDTFVEIMELLVVG
jgi:hypothetical protein